MQASGRTEFALLEFEKETSQMEAQYLEHENRSHFSIHIKWQGSHTPNSCSLRNIVNPVETSHQIIFMDVLIWFP